MTDEEADKLYNLFLDILSSSIREDEARIGFPKEIEDEIRAGRHERVNIRVGTDQSTRDPIVGTRTTSSKTQAEFVRRVDFSAHEKIRILVEGIDLARVAPPLMANRIFRMISAVESEESKTIVFDAAEREEPRSLSSAEVEAAVKELQPLRELLEDVRRELGSTTIHSSN